MANMTSLKNLTGGQLERMLESTQAEIKRRENIQVAVAEIQSVLKKYKITMQDLDLQVFNTKTPGKSTRTDKARARDNRKRVKAKYFNPNGTESWSGRGRAPSWVMEFCQKEGIELATFKKDNRFTKA